MATRYITCHICGKTMRKASLRRHMEDRHMPNHRSHCPYCPKTFRTSNSLQNHLSLYHRNFRKKRMAMMGGHVDPIDEQQHMNQLSQINQQILSQQINQQLNQHLNQQLGQYDQIDQHHKDQLRLELDMRRKQENRIDSSRPEQDRALDLDMQRDQLQLHHQQQPHSLPPVSTSLQTM